MHLLVLLTTCRILSLLRPEVFRIARSRLCLAAPLTVDIRKTLPVLTLKDINIRGILWGVGGTFTSPN